MKSVRVRRVAVSVTNDDLATIEVSAGNGHWFRLTADKAAIALLQEKLLVALRLMTPDRPAEETASSGA